MSDRLLNATTCDLQRSGPSYVEGDVVHNMIVMSISIPLASWEGDPTLGNEFALIERVIDNADTRRQFGELARSCLQWIVDLGYLERTEVEVEEFEPGGVLWELRAYEPGQDEPRAGLTFFTPIGGK